MTKEGFFKKSDYVYDEQYDWCMCNPYLRLFKQNSREK